MPWLPSLTAATFAQGHGSPDGSVRVRVASHRIASVTGIRAVHDARLEVPERHPPRTKIARTTAALASKLDGCRTPSASQWMTLLRHQHHMGAAATVKRVKAIGCCYGQADAESAAIKSGGDRFWVLGPGACAGAGAGTATGTVTLFPSALLQNLCTRPAACMTTRAAATAAMFSASAREWMLSEPRCAPALIDAIHTHGSYALFSQSPQVPFLFALQSCSLNPLFLLLVASCTSLHSLNLYRAVRDSKRLPFRDME
ncbi:hypothetical protein K431DRAFT_295787 [Polychaeton citri CBS 116435]|uniref:Uncharacterized protein n=1 Tax=Polychaeton citri CBS 116435 TaxID=1314669 RepID=A0A9P4Q7J1_9PEZI|nr:hypothetical protein K431DRAFT_295787 [Polychaeton citri CBS 116435]